MTRHYIFYLFLFASAFAIPAAAQTNVYAYGAYSGGSGDNTNVLTPPLKIQAPSGYIRVPHISADAGISTVYNYETGKDVYWGEATDAGNYWFRGRNMLVQNGKVGINTTTPQYPLDVAGHISCDDLIISNKYPGSSSLDLSLTD